MKTHFDKALHDLTLALSEHPVFERLRNLSDLRVFMGHHAYGVWDFMALLKALQQTIAPSGHPWSPGCYSTKLRRVINETVLEEESDHLPGGDGYASHFEIYLRAMDEIGCDSWREVYDFALSARTEGIGFALRNFAVPEPAREFMRFTFSVIDTGEAHLIASCFAFGRENIVPTMFRSLITRAGLSRHEAPCFFYYLERHMDVDENRHGPMSVEMLAELCGQNEKRIQDALAIARQSLEARLKFWDGVALALDAAQSQSALAIPEPLHL